LCCLDANYGATKPQARRYDSAQSTQALVECVSRKAGRLLAEAVRLLGRKLENKISAQNSYQRI